ncbi:inorganic phosphate transporter [Ramaria rubella]|nr:inorganic phosphate transporter [Ramaria rubella]
MASRDEIKNLNADGSSLADEKYEPAGVVKVPQRHVFTYKTKLSAVFTVIFSGIALCSDGYQAGVIGNLNLLFAEIFPKHVFTATIKTRLSNSFFIGEIVGQLFFGLFIDRIGRKTGVLMTTGFLILGVILSAAAHGKSDLGLLWMLIIARGLAGVGAGGEYPVCGTSSIEAADETQFVRKNRGFLIATIGDFAIDLGFVVAGIIPLIVLAAYGYTTHSTSTHGFNGIWRICFALGIVPPLSVLYFRLKMFNSTAFRNHAMKNGQLTLKVYGLVFRRYWRRIIGTCLCWFLYDFCSYPFGLFSSTIIGQLNPANTIIQNIGWGTCINAFYLPGCILGGYLLDKIGRRNTQMAGFFTQGIIGMILGGALAKIQTKLAAFIVVYGIFLSAAEAGPGVATILISGEVFPTPVRGTMLGFAAAWGKAGAAIGTQVFTPIQDAFSDEFRGQQAVFLIGSAVSLVGALATYFLIPDMTRELENEDEAWRKYLEANGVSTDNMGEALEESLSGSLKKQIAL